MIFVLFVILYTQYEKWIDYFFPLFLIPPEAKGPPDLALFCMAFKAACSSFCLALKARSSSSSSLLSFLGALRGFFFPPSRPDISFLPFCCLLYTSPSPRDA
eukprot:TRINITY_DN613_c0_g1_i3.p1 TRINITY_DN613_c0_g1~~TRINITY_DN613_c0_g1_i3.p1  ORF type:complete len:102 (+),score=10.16 TRINITY_DN613_c0_g1_i3:79-384(+)